MSLNYDPLATIHAEITERERLREREMRSLNKHLKFRMHAIKELILAMFAAQVVLLDERFGTSVKALDAAFAAAKLAVDTAQLAADKAVDRERDTTNKRFDAMEHKLSEMGSRVDVNTGGDTATAVAEVGRRANVMLVISAVSAVIAFAALLLVVVL